MKPHRLLIVFVIISCFPASIIVADITSVQIEVEGGTGGQGIVVTRGLDCFVITAEHVVGDAPLPIEVMGSDRKTSTAVRFKAWPTVDIAVIKIENPVEICGRDSYINLDGLEQGMEQNRLGELRIRGGDGYLFELKVQLVSWDTNYIYIKQQSAEQEIGKRLSGSMLYQGQQPLGLLVRVSTGQDRIGYVYRMDRINDLVSSFLPLTEPPEDAARFDDKLAGDILRKHINYMQTEDFCRNLWRVAKFVANPKDDTLYYVSQQNHSLGGTEYTVKSLLFPGVNSSVVETDNEKDYRFVKTIVGYLPSTMQYAQVRNTLEQAIDGCLNSDMNKKVGKIKMSDGMRQVDNRTSWIVYRTGFLGWGTGSADIWLKRNGREIVLRVWHMK